MYFRSFEDLARTLRSNLCRLPQDLDVVVGIPRSGMFPAGMVALHRNATLTDLDGFLDGRALQHGIRREKPGIKAASETWKNVLVIDDSIGTGGTMAAARARIAEAGRDCTIWYCAVYGAQSRHSEVDLVLEVCPLPRAFEWNLMHHPVLLANACLDIDGLLCVDPTAEENDDGPLYDCFLRDANPALLPTAPVGALVSSRLEKHRAATEDWLHRHGVRYDELHLLDLPSADERRRLKAHAPFKAEVYRSKKASSIFLESELEQARAIAGLSGKAVVCTSEMVLFDDSLPTRTVRMARRSLGAKKKSLLRLKSQIWATLSPQK